MPQLRFLLGATVLLLGSCSNGTEPRNSSGSLTFSSLGTGSVPYFSVSGAFDPNRAATSPWAFGVVDETADSLHLHARKPHDNGTYDDVHVWIGKTAVGDVAIHETCGTTVDDLCAGVTIDFEFNPANEGFTYTCFLTSGYVSITSISETRASGVFSGAGTCYSILGASSTFNLTTGTYDVALIPDPGL